MTNLGSFVVLKLSFSKFLLNPIESKSQDPISYNSFPFHFIYNSIEFTLIPLFNPKTYYIHNLCLYLIWIPVYVIWNLKLIFKWINSFEYYYYENFMFDLMLFFYIFTCIYHEFRLPVYCWLVSTCLGQMRHIQVDRVPDTTYIYKILI